MENNSWVHATLHELDRAEITVNAWENPRGQSDTERSVTEEFVGHIEENGIQSPVLVYETGEGEYVLFEGFRRMHAYDRIWEGDGPPIKCLRYNEPETAEEWNQLRLLQFGGNLAEKWSKTQLALHIRVLRDSGMKLEDIAKRTGLRSKQAVSHYLSATQDPDVAAMVKSGDLTVTAAAALGRGLSGLDSIPQEIQRNPLLGDNALAGDFHEGEIPEPSIPTLLDPKEIAERALNKKSALDKARELAEKKQATKANMVSLLKDRSKPNAKDIVEELLSMVQAEENRDWLDNWPSSSSSLLTEVFTILYDTLSGGGDAHEVFDCLKTVYHNERG